MGRTAGRRKNRCAMRAVNAPAGWRDNNTNMHTHLRRPLRPPTPTPSARRRRRLARGVGSSGHECTRAQAHTLLSTKKKVMSMGRAMMMIGTRGVVLRASDRRGENDRRACTDMRTNGVSVGVGGVGGTEKSYEACPLCQLAPQDEHTGSRSTRRDGRQKMRRARGCAGRRCV